MPRVRGGLTQAPTRRSRGGKAPPCKKIKIVHVSDSESSSESSSSDTSSSSSSSSSSDSREQAVNQVQVLKKQNECYRKQLLHFKKPFSLGPHLADLRLKIGDREILAHKLILSFASPIFYEMFSNTPVPKFTEIDIRDIDFETMQTLITFCYKYEVPSMKFQKAIDILKAAHKYQIKDLKEEVEKILIGHLSKETYADLLLLGKNYNADTLKKAVIWYIKTKVPC